MSLLVRWGKDSERSFYVQCIIQSGDGDQLCKRLKGRASTQLLNNGASALVDRYHYAVNDVENAIMSCEVDSSDGAAICSN